MQNNIKHLEINNFKSIKKLTIEPKRINLFIGKPNVGKSNILEALSMFCVPFAASCGKEKPLSSVVRFEELDNLFYFRDREKEATILTDTTACRFVYEGGDFYSLLIVDDKTQIDKFRMQSTAHEVYQDFSKYLQTKNLSIDRPGKSFLWFLNRNDEMVRGHNSIMQYQGDIRRYEYNKLTDIINNKFREYLLPPDGTNLTTVLDSFTELRNDVSSFFEEYNLKLVRNRSTNRFEILRIDGDYIDVLPYSLIADTLQRIIFYIAAIETNKDSVLLFEEPESHNFPPYVVTFANRVIESKDNQFFITTHSPYLLQEIIENTSKDELAIYRTYYEDHQTKVELIDDAEFESLGGFGYNIFFNI